jgi:hypothetical protein
MTLRRKVLLEKLIVAQPIKKSPPCKKLQVLLSLLCLQLPTAVNFNLS